MIRFLCAVSFLVFISSARAQDAPVESPLITPRITVAEAGSTYQIKIECDTRYPDGTALDVSVSQIRVEMDREIPLTIFHRTFKAEQHRFGDTVLIPVEKFQPARYEVRVAFTPDTQPEAMRNKVLNARVPLDPYTMTQNVRVGSARDLQKLMNADRRAIEDVIGRLEQAVERFGKQDAKATVQDFVSISGLLKEGPTQVPKTRREAMEFLKKLDTVAKSMIESPSLSRYRPEKIPGEGLPDGVGGVGLPAVKPAPAHLSLEQTDTSGIRSMFVREYAWAVVNELDRLYQEIDRVLEPRDAWKAFYGRATNDLSVLSQLLDDLGKSKAFSAALAGRFKDPKQTPAELILRLTALLDRCHGLIEHEVSVKEIREDPQIVTQRQDFQALRDALLKLCLQGN